jgi:hypothetical protein
MEHVLALSDSKQRCCADKINKIVLLSQPVSKLSFPRKREPNPATVGGFTRTSAHFLGHLRALGPGFAGMTTVFWACRG